MTYKSLCLGTEVDKDMDYTPNVKFRLMINSYF